MRRFSYKKYLLIILSLFVLITLPQLFVEKIRSQTVAFFSPFWRTVLKIKAPFKSKIADLKSEREKLEAENHLLRLEINRLRKVTQKTGNDCSAIAASVIYRDPSSWTSFFWVDIGEEFNQKHKKKIIEKNCPVVVGKAVVGLVDFVGKKHAKIRLITDLGCKPSVRVARGKLQDVLLIDHIDAILAAINPRSDLSKAMTELKTALSNNSKEWYLAKGVLQGLGPPFWKSKDIVLKGIGFNYDFADSYGLPRDLITGSPLGAKSQSEAIPLIEVNDLLITTGLDGVFPAGLNAAIVTKVFPLKIGASSYEIEAKPVVQNLDQIETVFIIPSVGFKDESSYSK